MLTSECNDDGKKKQCQYKMCKILKYRNRKDSKLRGRVPIIKLIWVNRGYLSSRKLISKNPGRGKDNRCLSVYRK